MMRNQGLRASISIPLFAILASIALAIYLYSSKSAAQDDGSHSYVLNNNSWEQLVLPGNASGSTIQSLFSDDLEKDEYGVTWIIYTFDSEANAYINPGISGSIEQAQGFWMIQRTGNAVVIDLPSNFNEAIAFASDACTGSSGCAVVQLATRANSRTWNMIGAPFPRSIPIADLQVATVPENSSCANGCAYAEAASLGIIGSELWRYDSKTNAYTDITTEDELKEWNGAWASTQQDAIGNAPTVQIPRLGELLPRKINVTVPIFTPQNPHISSNDPITVFFRVSGVDPKLITYGAIRNTETSEVAELTSTDKDGFYRGVFSSNTFSTASGECIRYVAVIRAIGT